MDSVIYTSSLRILSAGENLAFDVESTSTISRYLTTTPLALTMPLQCAGITIYAPMMCHKRNQPSKSLGMIGLGGLGHLAVKFGKVFRLHVTIFNISICKKEKGLNFLGVDKFVVPLKEQRVMVKIRFFIAICGRIIGPNSAYVS